MIKAIVEDAKPVNYRSAVNKYRRIAAQHSVAINSIQFISEVVPRVAGQHIMAVDVVVALAEIEVKEIRQKLEDAYSTIKLHVSQKFEIDVDDVGSSHWNCPTAPLNHCYYDLANDTWKDHCLYCDDPSERK